MSTQLEIRCLSCSVLSVREARFCRQCGAILRKDDPLLGADVSPDALTIELHEPKRQTTPLPSLEDRLTSQQEAIRTGDITLGPLEPAHLGAPIRGFATKRIAAVWLAAVVGVGGLVWWQRSHRLVNSPPPPASTVAQGPDGLEDPVPPHAPPDAVATDEPAVTPRPNHSPRSLPEPGKPERSSSRRVVEVSRDRDYSSVARSNPSSYDPSRVTAAQPPIAQPIRDESDALYRQGVNIVGNRDVKKLSRNELLRALQCYQNVKQGPNRENAAREAERLGREFDRRTWKK